MYLTKRDFPIDADDQSMEIPGRGGVRQSKLTPVGVTCEYLFSDAKTLVEVLQRGCKVSGNGSCLGWRDSTANFKWLTYEKVIQRSRNISSGLICSGMKRGQETFVGIYAQNCVEWVLVEQACYYQSTVTVPLYETFGIKAIMFILNQVEAEVVICDTEKRVSALLDVRNELSSLKQIIAIKKDLGKRKSESLKLPSPSDLATICYTSGTTGNPKGVMLTHGNIVADASAFLKHLGSNYVGVRDRHLSYLPLPHITERLSHVVLFSCGASIGFFRGDIKLLSEDIRSLKPTIFITVPRVLNRIYDKVQNEVNTNMVKKFLLKVALQAKQAELEGGLIRNNSVWDYLVLKNIRNALGGKVRLVITGGAPIRDEILSFLRCCLGCPVLQVYGQTEASGAVITNVIGEYSGGNSGPPIPCCFVKLIDVPEMNYYAQKGEGEILVKGPNVTKGYYKEPLKTAKLIDDDGWIHTGDVGRWMKNGSLAIIDRKTNILKLSQGEFVSPEKVETVYLASPYVEQIFVYGGSLENCLVAVVVPDKEALLLWCSQSNITGEWDKICQNKVVRKHILKHLNQLGQKAGLQGFEQVKAIYLHPEAFSQENGILTATMKVKRLECYRRFKDIIQNMYKTLL